MKSEVKYSRVPPHEIFQYLLSQNFNITSQKVLRQPHPNYDVCWGILSYLSLKLYDHHYEQLQPLIIHNLSSPENHLNSLKRIKEYIIVSSVLKKLGFENEYPFRELLKPQKETLIAKISALIHARKYQQSMLKAYDTPLTQLKILKSQYRDLKVKNQELEMQIRSVEEEKQREKPLCQEKEKSIALLSKQFNYKRKEKFDMLDSKESLEHKINEKRMQKERLLYDIQNNKISIKDKQRERINNAPKLKKDRLLIKQNYEVKREKYESEKKVKQTIISELKNALKVQENLTKKVNIKKIQEQITIKNQQRQNLERLKEMIKEREVMKEELYQKKNELMNSIHSIHQEQKEENESLKEISMANSSIKNTIASWKNEIIYMEKIIRDNQVKCNEQNLMKNKLNCQSEKSFLRMEEKINQANENFEKVKESAERLLHDFMSFEQNIQ